MILFHTFDNIVAFIDLQAFSILLFISSFVISVILITYKSLEVNIIILNISRKFCFRKIFCTINKLHRDIKKKLISAMVFKKTGCNTLSVYI